MCSGLENLQAVSLDADDKLNWSVILLVRFKYNIFICWILVQLGSTAKNWIRCYLPLLTVPRGRFGRLWTKSHQRAASSPGFLQNVHVKLDDNGNLKGYYSADHRNFSLVLITEPTNCGHILHGPPRPPTYAWTTLEIEFWSSVGESRWDDTEPRFLHERSPNLLRGSPNCLWL